MNILQKYFNFFILCIVIYLVVDKVFSVEKMSNSDIKKLIEDEYRIDVDSIRNLSKLANELTVNNLFITGGLDVLGPLIVVRKITTNKDITANENITVNKDINVKNNVTIDKNLNVKKQTTLHELLGGKSSVNGFRAIQVNGGHIMFDVGNYGYGFHNNGYRYQRHKNSYSNNNFSGKVYVNGDLQTTGNGYFGPAYVGKYGGTNSDYAHFSHKDMRSTSQYALLQYKLGHTYLNTANRGIYFRNNNSTKMEMKNNGTFYINGNYAFKHGDNTLLYNKSHNAYVENCGHNKKPCSGGYGVRSHPSKAHVVSGGSGKFTLLKI